MRTWPLLLASHALVGAAGFALGVYLLPFLIAPSAPGPDPGGKGRRK